MSSLTPLHHLPRPAQNLPYLIELAVAPLINLAISINSFHHFQTLSGQQLPINHWIFGVSKFVLSGILILLTINLLRILWLGHHQIRRTLLAFGILSTLDLLLNLATITAGIYSFKLGSFYLLLIALGLYCSLNLIFGEHAELIVKGIRHRRALPALRSPAGGPPPGEPPRAGRKRSGHGADHSRADRPAADRGR
jgi:hypothetical protein